MTVKDDRPEQAAELRERAEQILREKADAPQENLEAPLSDKERRTLHELQVHQIEMEMQNEELRLAQAELEAARERYFDLYDLAPMGYCTISEQGVILEANLTAVTLLGMARGALVNQPVSRFIFKEDWDIYYLRLKQLFETGEPQGCELRMVKLDGSVFWAHLATTDVKDSDGVPVCCVVISEITERKQAEKTLEESIAHYKGLFSSMQEGFVLLDIIHDADGTPKDFRIMEVNPAFENLFALNRDMVIGSSLNEVFPLPEEYWRKNLANVAQTGEPVILENYSSRHDRYFEEQAYKPAEGLIALLFTDLTERRKLQEEREKGQRLESLGLLAGGIAHDFNNILTAIFGNISLARMLIGEEHKASVRLIACENAMSRAKDLTRQLLTFACGGDPIKGIVDTERLILEAVLFSVRGSNCTSVFHLAKDLRHMDADAGQLHQAINNLVINAIQAMPDGGNLTISAVNETVKPDNGQALPCGRYVKISVSDQGCGIPSDILSRIFDPYFTTKATGSGLGLTSAYSIIKRHGGNITVSSRPGSGTTFDILIPAADEMPGKSAAVPEQAPTAMPGKSILVMDDEEVIRSLASDMLEELGYTVVTCEDGAEAVRIYREFRERGEAFAAVILDMTVAGGMGGMDAAKRIRSIDPGAVLVISSGYSVDLEIAEKDNLLFSGSVAKPYSLHELARELSRVLNHD